MSGFSQTMIYMTLHFMGSHYLLIATIWTTAWCLRYCSLFLEPSQLSVRATVYAGITTEKQAMQETYVYKICDLIV